MDHFKEDRLENEKKDPSEQSSLRFVKVPIVLLSMFVGFGVTYLTLRTDSLSMNFGDSRTDPATPQAQPAAAVSDEKADPSTLTENGKRIYAATCQACHQAGGNGIPGAFPPLDASEWVNGPPKLITAIILHGLQGEINVKGQKFNAAMPPFKDQLSPADVAAVATYVRQAWTNKSTPVMKDIVISTLAETQSRSTAWAGEEELKKQKWE